METTLTLKMIKRYDRKRFAAEPWAASLVTEPWYKEESQNVREKA